MEGEAKIISILSEEEARLVELAQGEGDAGFIRNMRVIRAELLVLLAQEELDKREVSTRALAQKFGVSEGAIRRLRESGAFKEELKRFILDRVVGQENMLTAERQFREALERGAPWAIQYMLKRMEGAGGKSKENLEDVV